MFCNCIVLSGSLCNLTFIFILIYYYTKIYCQIFLGEKKLNTAYRNVFKCWRLPQELLQWQLIQYHPLFLPRHFSLKGRLYQMAFDDLLRVRNTALAEVEKETLSCPWLIKWMSVKNSTFFEGYLM
jgi:hypothetical protein